MYNITLISTEHRESGKCNTSELHKIIESISPEVIFEEETNDERYQKYYNEENSYNSLEIQCIKKYLLNHDIKHVPVDAEPNQYLTFQEWDYMFDTFKKYSAYNQIVKEHCTLRDREGFSYLNSEACMEIHEKMKITERQLIEFSGINKSELLRIYKLFHKEHDFREGTMILNIYNYSKENQYNKAVFLIGYAHRKSITQKIIEYEKRENLELIWTFYNDHI
ncbi:MAG: hypothetical protein FD166_886 [Bacteroidetes bacterium]|nr:MAG: hypothetical protein FD166_886 [Bacteroidota bacterium]